VALRECAVRSGARRFAGVVVTRGGTARVSGREAVHVPAAVPPSAIRGVHDARAGGGVERCAEPFVELDDLLGGELLGIEATQSLGAGLT